jgi:hypothetical protein
MPNLQDSSPVPPTPAADKDVTLSTPLLSEGHFTALDRSRRRAKFLLISGIVVLVLSSVMRGVFPIIVNDVVWKETSITSADSPLYDAWVNPASAGVNIYRSYTFYNLTNPYEVVAGMPPNFVERGPYVYEEIRAKVPSSIQWFDNGTVGYTYTSTYQFVPEKSFDTFTGEQLNDVDDVLQLPNAPLIGLTHRLSLVPNDLGHISWIPITKQECCVLLDIMVNATVGPQGMFVHRSVHEVLWGYEDPIWASVHETLAYINYTASRIFRSEWNGTYTLPSPYSFRSGQMCPLWEHNDACNTTTNLYTLEGSGSDRDGPVGMGHLSQWAGQRSLWWWGEEMDTYTGGMEVRPQPERAVPDYNIPQADPICRDVVGSDGLRFGPGVTESSSLKLFLDMLWRTMPLSYWKDTTVKDIPAMAFSVSGPVLDNTTEVNQRCYHMRKFGLFNFSKPLFGPAFAAKARLLDAKLDRTDVNYTLQRPVCTEFIDTNSSSSSSNEVECVDWALSPRRNVLDYLEYYFQRESQPDAFRETFESRLNVHGLTGITLSGVAQGEALTELKPIAVDGCPGLFKSFANVSSTFIPLVNVQRSTEVSDSYAQRLRTALLWLDIAGIVLYVGIGLGIGMLMGGIFWLRSLKRPPLDA